MSSSPELMQSSLALVNHTNIENYKNQNVVIHGKVQSVKNNTLNLLIDPKRDNKHPERLSAKEKYELYSQIKPKKNENKMGSMKNGATSTVKEYYSEDEISKLTEEDLSNPQVWEAVRRSQTMNYKPY